MPPAVKLDTLYIAPGPFGQFQFATIAYTDPFGVNKYRFVQYVNGSKDPEIFWENDEFTDGQKVVIQLDTGVDKQDDPRNINSGDQVTIEMLGIDQAVYKYWYSLQSGGGDGGGNSAAPANPDDHRMGKDGRECNRDPRLRVNNCTSSISAPQHASSSLTLEI